MYSEKNTIEETIKNILSNASGMENIENSATLKEDLALDSISMIYIIFDIEEAFEIQLDESDMNPNELITVQNVINLVYRYRGE